MFGREIPKQRGIYSEILTTEDADNLKVSLIIPKLILSTGSFNLWTKQGGCMLSELKAKDAKSNG